MLHKTTSTTTVNWWPANSLNNQSFFNQTLSHTAGTQTTPGVHVRGGECEKYKNVILCLLNVERLKFGEYHSKNKKSGICSSLQS